MANPFEVQAPNIFDALMSGVSAYGTTRRQMKERELEDGYAEVGNQIATKGAIDKASLGKIIGMGPQAAPLLTAIGSIGKADQTDTLKNLSAENAARAAKGLPPMSPLEYQTAVSQAGANKSTINMPPQEKAYDQAMGKELADMNIGIIKGAASARTSNANLDRLEQLLQDPGVYQGTAGEKVLQAKKIAKSLGIDVGEGVGGAEAVQSISNQLALQARNPAGGAGMPGSMSDSDRAYLKEMQPGLEKTPDGNRLIVDVNRKLNQRAIDVEQFRQNYIKKKGRLDEGFYRDLAEWSNSNPLFPNGAASGQSAQAQMQMQPRQGRDGNYYVPDPARPGKYLMVNP
ncbi:hypothetical protein [Bradyrhizobium sp. G127]|uniref:hypothetical protein n=1 Tax=Bradyrhizobium sp. G127 TaxID=2904800 RepID=UPI001F21C16E|nr:hypothetical protein [Bradyrhizobium sp. G127]MCF2523911.1 hypothetical protein [Bradyrhizobium sp. G127]